MKIRPDHPGRTVRSTLVLLIAVLTLGGCDRALTAVPEGDITPARGPQVPLPPQAPVARSTLPTYPALAIYIVYREYIHRNPRLTSLDQDDPRYQAYMERRLMQLYPERGGYRGMMRDARAEARSNLAALARYERDLELYRAQLASYSAPLFSSSGQCGDTSADPSAGADPSWNGQDEFPVPPDEMIPTIRMEIDSLQLVGVEVDNIYYYEELAAGTYTVEPGGPGGPGGGSGGGGSGGYEIDQPLNAVQQASIDELIRAAAAGQTPYSEQAVIQATPLLSLAGGVALGIVGWKVFRLLQAETRAHQKSTAFYPHLHSQDTQRDAHRHIYVSMMFRRYVGAALAKGLLDWNERDSTGPARVMDLHNNDIGRQHRYNAFRGHWLWDRWDHNEWAVKVRNYVDNASVNGEYIPEWDVDPAPTTEQAWARQACVPVYKYIYFSKDGPS